MNPLFAGNGVRLPRRLPGVATPAPPVHQVPQSPLPTASPCGAGGPGSTTVTSPPLKCQDVCPPSLNNGPSTSILPAIAYPKDNSSSLFKNNSSSQFKEQKTVRVRNDRLKTDEENKDTAASCGTSSPKRTSSSDDDIKEQKSSQGPDVSIYSFSLREQKNAVS